MRRIITTVIVAALTTVCFQATAATPAPKATTHKPSLLPTVSKPKVKSSTPAKRTTTSTHSSSVKRYVRHVYKRRYVAPIPSPAPSWPPANFYSEQGVYINYKVSTSALVGALSAASSTSDLYKDSQLCSTQVCGVVQLGSETGCDWWEVDSTLYGLVDTTTSNTLIRGTLKTFAPGTAARQIITNYLVSPLPITPGDRVVPSKALCWSKSSGTKPPAQVPDNNYVAYPSK